jgi:hypothetical protein
MGKLINFKLISFLIKYAMQFPKLFQIFFFITKWCERKKKKKKVGMENGTWPIGLT